MSALANHSMPKVVYPDARVGEPPPAAPSAELVAELQQEWPDGPRLRELILREYSQNTGISFGTGGPSDRELDAVVAWMTRDIGNLAVYLLKRSRSLVPSYSSCLSSKISRLAQFHCPICKPKDGPIWQFPIRISPASKQAKSAKRRAAFERAIRHRFAGRVRPLPDHASICLLVVFVVKARARQKDLDNMAKAILDAVKNVLFGDDRQIDHLNLIRIKSPDEEYVYLNLRETRLNDHADILSPRLHHEWAVA